MAFQHWYCEKCGKESTEQHRKDAGVWEVKEQIAFKHRFKSSVCARANGLTAVRLGFPTSGGSHE